MDIILIPGLWLDASSWNEVVPALESAGHRVHALTLPGVDQPAEASGEIGIAEWVDAVIQQIDEVTDPVVLVGHSGGGNVVWGAADARTDRVARVVFVDTVPPHPGSTISAFPIVDGVIPFPGWDFFPEEDVYDIDAQTRTRALPQMRSVPARIPTDPIALTGDRHRVPVTLLMGSLTHDALDAQIDQWGPYAVEYRAIDDVTVLKIGSGHWPQFTQPARLAELIDAASAQ